MYEFRLRFDWSPVNDIPALVQIMSWHRPGDKSLSEPVMVSLLAHIRVTRPEWVNLNESHYEVPSHHLNHCRHIVNYILRNFSGILIWIDRFLWKNGFENVVCKMLTIFTPSPCSLHVSTNHLMSQCLLTSPYQQRRMMRWKQIHVCSTVSSCQLVFNILAHYW